VGRDMLWQAQWAIAAGWVARRVPPGSTVVPFQKRKKVSKKRGNVAESWFTSVQRKLRVGIGGNDASRRRGERGHRPAAKEA